MRHLQITLDNTVFERIEQYRKRQPGEIPSKAAAVRELIETGLRVDAGELASE
jgi:hypothetical protein